MPLLKERKLAAPVELECAYLRQKSELVDCNIWLAARFPRKLQ